MESLGEEWILFVIIFSAFMFLFCLSALAKKLCIGIIEKERKKERNANKL
jgi:hypothetical protein